MKQACEDAGVEALGYLPKQADVEIPSRHLGLTLDETFCFDTFADRVAALVEKHVDIDRLLALTACQPVSNSHMVQLEQTLPSPLKISIARDAAFNFAYEENIQLLHRLGEVTFSVRFTIPYYRNPILYTCPEAIPNYTFPVYHQTVPCFNLSAIMQKQEGSYLPNAEE